MSEESLRPKSGTPVPPLTYAQQQGSSSPLFTLGTVVATPGALALLAQYGIQPLELLRRHVSGDWGELCSSDKHANSLALVNGERILSSYSLDKQKPADPDGVRVWILTERDRSVTTVLRPSEY